jgi:hypothetical protein
MVKKRINNQLHLEDVDKLDAFKVAFEEVALRTSKDKVSWFKVLIWNTHLQ